LAYRPVALIAASATFAFEGWGVVSACWSAHRRSRSAVIGVAAVRPKLH